MLLLRVAHAEDHLHSALLQLVPTIGVDFKAKVVQLGGKTVVSGRLPRPDGFLLLYSWHGAAGRLRRTYAPLPCPHVLRPPPQHRSSQYGTQQGRSASAH